VDNDDVHQPKVLTSQGLADFLLGGGKPNLGIGIAALCQVHLLGPI
jgi:hypothetical protein